MRKRNRKRINADESHGENTNKLIAGKKKKDGGVEKMGE
jgi:hypothetical protein